MRAGTAPREIANNLSTSIQKSASDQREQAQTRRADRYLKRAALWHLSNLQRVRYCGRHPSSASSGVGVRLTGGAAGFANLQTCGSVWADPVCSSKILARRAVEIGAALSIAQALGYQLGFVTLTMRHRKAQALGLLWDAAGRAWQRAISGQSWKLAQSRNGVVGWVRVWEVTTGRNGWHVHVHAVVVLDGSASSTHLDEVAQGMFRRWRAGLTSAGLEAPTLRGQEWHIVSGDQAGDEVAAYLAKLGRSGPASPEALGLELTHVQPGRSRSALRTAPVWSLLDDVVLGDAAAIRSWHEWESESKGRRQVGWSAGLRDRLSMPDERSDDEVAADELGTEDDTLVVIQPDGWRALVATPWRLPAVLDAAEAGGLPRLRSLLDSWGDVPYLAAL